MNNKTPQDILKKKFNFGVVTVTLWQSASHHLVTDCVPITACAEEFYSSLKSHEKSVNNHFKTYFNAYVDTLF